MNTELQNQLFQAAPILYAMALKSPAWKIGAPDDLFPFLNELSLEIEKFNMRYRRRAVRVMKIAMVGGELDFLVHRQVPAIEKKIVSARYRIRRYRKELRAAFLLRAKHMGTTALCGSALIPDWKRTMPDDTATLRMILRSTEKFAVSKGDWKSLAEWYRRYLHDEDDALRCQVNALQCE